MSYIMNIPRLVFVLSFVLFWLSANLGAFLGLKLKRPNEDPSDDFGVVQAALLTLLGLLIGFTFSMAVNRYDQRKNYEEAEANAIGTEYVRADLLPLADAPKVRELLRSYLDQRILFYTTRDELMLQKIDSSTARLQTDLWNAVRTPASASPSPVTALVAAGMNDVLNSQGYTQAAWWNRIPSSAWGLMSVIAFFCNVLIGYGVKRVWSALFFILPLAVAISFLLIADLDSPRRGLIQVEPQDLISLSQSLQAH
jgi:hypothetical protein